MLLKRPDSALIAIFSLVALCATPALSSDLTIPRTAKHAAMARFAAIEKPRAAGKANGKNQPAKAQRAEKENPPRIVTYKLRDDLALKLNGLGSGLAASQAPDIMGSPAKPVSAVTRQEAANRAAIIAFGCRERPFYGSLAKREVTACFQTSLDRSWKTQTYVSKEISDGRQNWGGGLAFAYAY